MGEHTPGPWHASRHARFVNTVNNHPVAEVIGERQEFEANARLIAAAPDMLAALYEAREFIDGQIDVVDGSYGEPAPNRAMVLAQEIDAAIAKATGSLPNGEEP